MAKRPSLFAIPNTEAAVATETVNPEKAVGSKQPSTRRPPSREGKRTFSVYLDPLAWKQLRQLALDNETTTQALGEEAVNLLFAKHKLNRSA